MTLTLDGNSLTLETLMQTIAMPGAQITLSDAARAAVQRSRDVVERWVEDGKVIYGVTTGFGEFANVYIKRDDLEQLQENLILSHAVGAGAWMPADIVRTMILLRVNALAKGYSGVRLQTLDALMAMFNHSIVPCVPEQGSVGSSGDLVQLSHIALALIGKGKCFTDAGIEPSADVLRRHGIEPIRLQAKEGLALINGTQMQLAYGASAVQKALMLMELADRTGALTADALRSTDRAFDERLHKARGMKGQLETAQTLRTLMHDSEIRNSHREGDSRVQDAYSIRCMPQVHGASRDAINYVHSIVAIELNAATDNPLIFPDDEAHIEGGNFHGQPMALALDFLTIACAELCNISERRTERMVNGALSNGLPRFLTTNGGVQSGMMIAQYTAASIVSENKVLAHPASVDSIPTSANQEDHNSMGSIAAQKAWKVANNLQTVLAIELLCAAQAIDFHRPLKTSPALELLHAAVRRHVPFATTDRILYDDIAAIRNGIEAGEIR
ncbi:MAG: histidine ammonia-lyase [Candidatus Kapabacteria bacterium]|nr:histidine ammonia-lyase [Candidatus Kapabacteria bacterium]